MDDDDRLKTLEERLNNGYALLEQKRAAGYDVSRLEDFWQQLLQEYEALSEEVGEAEGMSVPKRDIRKCDGCKGPIVWRFTPDGARMPLDAGETMETGKGVYVLEGSDRCRQYEPLLDGAGRARHMNHWATCKNRDAFRKKKPARKRKITE